MRAPPWAPGLRQYAWYTAGKSTCRWSARSRNAEPFATAAAVSKAVSGRAVGARPSTQTVYSLSPVAVWPNGDPKTA